MTTIIEAVYENGVLKPHATTGLKEHQRYRLILEEVSLPELPTDPALAAELARRTTVLPDGGKSIDILGLFQQEDDLSFEAIEEALDQSRQHQLEEWDELHGPEQE